MSEIRDLLTNAVPIPEDNKPNDNVDLLNNDHPDNSSFIITIRGTLRSEVLTMIDDIEMTLQLLTPKIVDLNQRLLSKERELFDSLKTKFNDEIEKKLERVLEEKSAAHQGDLEKEVQALQAKLSEAELNFTFCQNQLIEAEKKLEDKANEEKIALASEEAEQSQREIKELQSKIGKQ